MNDQTARLLAIAANLLSSPLCTEEKRIEIISAIYRVGHADGRIAGAQAIMDRTTLATAEVHGHA